MRRFAPVEVTVTPRADGALVLRDPRPAPADLPTVGAVLARRAAEAPERPFLVERREGGWRAVGYRAARARVEAIAAHLLAHDLGPARPLLILSENAIDHALAALAAMEVGVPAAPVSPAYALASRDHRKLRAIAELLAPGMVYVEDGRAYAPALAALALAAPVVASREPPPGGLLLDDLCAPPGEAARARVEAARAQVGPDTVAKVLFTSGSTGEPKGVLNTQRMLAANQAAIAAGWPLLGEKPPVVVDWLPWSHTFGGNHNFNLVLWHGGTLYVDRGKPTPALIGETVAMLAEVSPTLYFNVPRGFAALAPFLERDAGLRRRFFGALDLLFYAAAALPAPLAERLSSLAAGERPDGVPFVSAWGATETAPMATQVHEPRPAHGSIGVPAPGVDLKLVPCGDGRFELRVRGPSLTPGYWRRPSLLAEALDDEGYWRTGDAARFADAADPARGLVFDGRLAEDFKLSSGTWVRVGALRLALVAAGAPLVADVAIAGEGRDAIGALVFLDRAATATRDEARAAIARALAAHNAAAAGASALTVARALVLDEPPSIDAGEITDKGYLNQRAVLARRAAEVSRLFDDADPALIRPATAR